MTFCQTAQTPLDTKKVDSLQLKKINNQVFQAGRIIGMLFLWRDYTGISPNGNSMMKRVPVGSLFLTLMNP